MVGDESGSMGMGGAAVTELADYPGVMLVALATDHEDNHWRIELQC